MAPAGDRFRVKRGGALHGKREDQLSLYGTRRRVERDKAQVPLPGFDLPALVELIEVQQHYVAIARAAERFPHEVRAERPAGPVNLRADRRGRRAFQYTDV